MLAIGADVHMKTTTFFALDEEGKPLKEFNRLFKRVPSNLEGYSQVCGYLDGEEYQILVENSSKTHDVKWIAEELCMNMIVGHSPDLKKITQSDTKTDDNDAEDLAMYLLARFAGAMQFHVCYMCDRETMMDRQLCRLAKLEMMERGKIKRRIRSHALVFGIQLGKIDLTSKTAMKMLRMKNDPIFDGLVSMMEDSLRRQKELEKLIEQKFKGDPIYDKVCEIPYFGSVTGAYLSSYIADISRFPDSKSFVASLGLVPRARNSGEKVSHCKITKKGDPHARWLLIQATIGHVRGCTDSPVTEFFNRKNGGSLAERKEREEEIVLNRSAIVAASAKMATIIYTLVVKDRHW